MWGLSSSIIFLSFHTAIPLAAYLNAFGALAFFWLLREMQYFQTRSESSTLRNLGEVSYSIYLMHTHGPALIFAVFGIRWSSSIGSWAASLATSAVIATLFYVLIEKPSHGLARSLSRTVTAKPAVATVGF
jgi:peptidoglycan/LPS O-acetylase OafA/YrhL